jgi:hypothetical protein
MTVAKPVVAFPSWQEISGCGAPLVTRAERLGGAAPSA